MWLLCSFCCLVSVFFVSLMDVLVLVSFVFVLLIFMLFNLVSLLFVLICVLILLFIFVNCFESSGEMCVM